MCDCISFIKGAVVWVEWEQTKGDYRSLAVWPDAGIKKPNVSNIDQNVVAQELTHNIWATLLETLYRKTFKNCPILSHWWWVCSDKIKRANLLTKKKGSDWKEKTNKRSLNFRPRRWFSTFFTFILALRELVI